MRAITGLGLGTLSADLKARAAAPRAGAVSYLGFRTTCDGREYALRVGGLEPRFFVLLITHEAFAARQARFQDAPDLCFGKLQRELAAHPDLLPGLRIVLTDDELLQYRKAREKPNVGGKRRAPAR